MGPLTAALTWLAVDAPGVGDGGGDGNGEDVVVPDDVLPGQETVRSFTEQVAEAMPNDLLEAVVRATLEPALQVLLILLLAALVLRLARRLITRAVEGAKDPDGAPFLRRREPTQTPTFSLRRAQRADALGALAASVVTVVVWVLAAFLVLAEFGLDLAPLVAGAGVIGLAVGFGAQDLVKDFLSGVFMLAEDQFGVGDIIDVGEASGVVEGVTLRTTKVRDIEGMTLRPLWNRASSRSSKV